MIAEIEAAKRERDTLGGVTEVRAFGVPAGARVARLEPRPRLDGRLAAAMLVDPVREGRRDRRRDRLGRPPRVERPRRDPALRRARLPPRDRPRRRARGRHDERRRADRPGDLEAAADADAAAATASSWARTSRARRTSSAATSRCSRPRRWSPRPCVAFELARAALEKFGGDAVGGPGGRPPRLPRAHRPGMIPGPVPEPRPDRLHGRRQDHRRRACWPSELGWDAVDADAAIEQAAGKPVAAIFADDGEAAFRELEERVVGDLLQRIDTVVSLGGGAVESPLIRERLRDGTFTVLLDVSPQTAWRRVEAEAGERPLAVDPSRFADLYRERQPAYRDAADALVDADEMNGLEPLLVPLCRTGAIEELPRLVHAAAVGAGGRPGRAAAGRARRSSRWSPCGCRRARRPRRSPSPARRGRGWQSSGWSAATSSSGWAAAPRPTWPGSWRRPTSAACPGSPSRPRCWGWWTPRSAARPASTCPPRRTTSARSTPPSGWSPTPACSTRCRCANGRPGSPR